MGFLLVSGGKGRLISALLLVCAICLAAAGGYAVRRNRPRFAYLETASAQVERVRPVGEGYYLVGATYYDGPGRPVAVEGELKSTRTPRPGDQILVHYNPLKPREYYLVTPFALPPEFLLFFAILVGGVGFRLFVRLFFAEAKRSFIRENGRCIQPDTVEIEEIRYPLLRFFSVPAVRIHCIWTNPYRDGELHFYSDALPRPRRREIDLQEARVCFLTEAPDRYFVEF